VWISAFCAGVSTDKLYGCGGEVAWSRILDDFVDATGCKWLLEFGNGALGLSIAAFKLWDRLAVYVVDVCERKCLRRWWSITRASLLAAAWLVFVLRG